MQRLAASLALSFTFSFLLPSSSVFAFSVRSVSEERAQGEVGSIVKLKVWPGYGLNINFIPTGEIIKKVWLDDPSRIAISFDGTLCQGNQDQRQGCTNEGATVIHLRKIKPIEFKNLPHSPGGGTLLTVVTLEQGERDLYQFQIVAATGEPKYTSLKILPDSDKPAPIQSNAPLVTTSAPSSQQDDGGSDSSASSEALKQLLTSVSYANDVVTGLMVADNKGQIAHGSKMWRKVQDAIYHLRRGESKEVAASRSGVPLSLLSQLIAWGQQESGSKSEVKRQKSKASVQFRGSLEMQGTLKKAKFLT